MNYSILQGGFADLRRDKSFLFQKRLPLPSSCFSGGWIFLKASRSFLCKVVPGFHCFDVTKSLGGRLQYCAEAPPPPLQSCSKYFGSLLFVLAEGFLACLLCTLIFSRRFLGFDSCFESIAPWLFWCIAYILICFRNLKKAQFTPPLGPSILTPVHGRRVILVNM